MAGTSKTCPIRLGYLPLDTSSIPKPYRAVNPLSVLRKKELDCG